MENIEFQLDGDNLLIVVDLSQELGESAGMRRGELLGLKWQDINLDEGVLQVRRALTRMPTGQGYQEIEPKTKVSGVGLSWCPLLLGH